jgi:hypothetical protein
VINIVNRPFAGEERNKAASIISGLMQINIVAFRENRKSSSCFWIYLEGSGNATTGLSRFQCPNIVLACVSVPILRSYRCLARHTMDINWSRKNKWCHLKAQMKVTKYNYWHRNQIFVVCRYRIYKWFNHTIVLQGHYRLNTLCSFWNHGQLISVYTNGKIRALSVRSVSKNLGNFK